MAANPDPFTPGETTDLTAGLPDVNTYKNLVGQWNNFLDQPGGRAQLLSIGLSLLQPPSFGDNPASQIGRAIGAGGETQARQEAMDIKQKEADTKALLREAQATAAGARASQQAQAAETARERIQSGRERDVLSAKVRLSQAYQGYLNGLDRGYNQELANWQKIQRDSVVTGAPVPPAPVKPAPLPIDQWVQQNSLARDLIGAGGGAPAQAPAAAAPTSGAAPQAPTADQREVGQLYTTPKGVLRWKGNGQWETP